MMTTTHRIHEIQVPEGNKLFLVTHAVGVQIYTCEATADVPYTADYLFWKSTGD